MRTKNVIGFGPHTMARLIGKMSCHHGLDQRIRSTSISLITLTTVQVHEISSSRKPDNRVIYIGTLKHGNIQNLERCRWLVMQIHLSVVYFLFLFLFFLGSKK